MPLIDPATLTAATANAMHIGTATFDDFTGTPEIHAGGSAYVAIAHKPDDALALNGQLAASGWRLTSTLRNETAGFSSGVWTRT